MIVELAKADFRKRFVGSYFGVVWMFVQPIVTILIYFCIFQLGFKSTPPVPDTPYVLWLVPGIIPWFFFQEFLRPFHHPAIQLYALYQCREGKCSCPLLHRDGRYIPDKWPDFRSY